ncbi:hypothetical protein HDZ31DRAFT_64908 [Schizophyllum fasciatum]
MAGGFYLFAQHENYRRNELSLLRLPGADEGKRLPVEVAKTIIPQNTHTGRIHDYWFVERSRNVLRVCALEILTVEKRYQISVYEVDAAAKHPEFTVLARTSDFGSIVSPTSKIKHCGEDRISLCDDKVAVLSDFMRDLRVELDIVGPTTGDSYVMPHIKVADNRVVYLQRHLVAIYVLPTDACGALGPLKPAFQLNLSGQCNVYFPHPATLQPLVFHVHNRTWNKIRTYALSSGTGTPRAVASRSVAKSGLYRSIWGPAPFVACAGAHVLVRISPMNCRHVHWVDEEEGRKPSASAVKLMHEDSGGMVDNAEFDPVSGRMVVVNSSGTLRIFDYI